MTTTVQTPAAATTASDSPMTRLRRRWPALAGLAFAVFAGYDVAGGADLAPVLVASGLIYLGAAALGRQAAAWPLFFGTFVVIGVGTAIGGPDPTWVLIGFAVLLAGYGVVRGAQRSPAGLPRQALAMVVVGVAAAVTVLVGGAVGGFLVAAGLLAHAAWDAYHHRVNRVVVRSMAEFCFVLDTLLAVAVIVATLR
jgi:hypothetical protein